MPRRAREGRETQAGGDGLSDIQRAYLWDEDLPAQTKANAMEHFRYCSAEDRCTGAKPSLKDMWTWHRDEILAVWIEEYVGSRPSFWWEADSPRAGPPAKDRQGHFIYRRQEGRTQLSGPRPAAGNCDWRLGLPVLWDIKPGDADVVFESQGTYLRRKGLLLPGELERMTDEDFAPEVNFAWTDLMHSVEGET